MKNSNRSFSKVVVRGMLLVWMLSVTNSSLSAEESERRSEVNVENFQIGIESKEYSGLYLLGETPSFNLTLDNRSSGRERNLSLIYRVKDYDNQEVLKKSLEKKVHPEASSSFKIALPIKKKGLYHLIVEAEENSRLIGKKITRFAILPHPDETVPSSDSFFGVHVFFVRIAPEEINEKRIRALKRLGIKRVRTGAKWYQLEREKGKLVWENEGTSDFLIDTYKKYGFDIFIFLEPVAPIWARSKESLYPGIPKRRGKDVSKRLASIFDYEEFCFKVAERYKGKVKYYEIMNEPDFSIVHVPTYLKFVKAGYRGIKRADPEAIVSAAGIHSMFCREGFLTEFLESGGDKYCDRIGFHPYNHGNQLKKQNWIKKLCQKYNLRMLIGEWNTGLLKGGVDSSRYNSPLRCPAEEFPQEEKRWASSALKSILIGKMTPEIEAYFWWVMSFDEGPYGYRQVRHSSFFGRRDNLLAAGALYANLASLLEGFTFKRKLNLKNRGIWAPVFKKGDESILVLWSDYDTLFLPASFLNKRIKVLDILGNEKPPGKTGIEINKEPIYIISSEKQIENLSQKLESFGLASAEIKITDIFFTIDKELAIFLKNNTPGKASLEIEVSYPGGENFLQVELAEREEKKITAKLKRELKEKEEIPVKILLRNKDIDWSRERKFILSLSPAYTLTAVKKEKEIIIDGSLSDWPKKKPIYLDQKSQVALRGLVWEGEEDLSAIAYLMYDKDYLYFAADVKDDIHLNDQSAGSMWKQDNIQLGIGGLQGNYAEISFALTSEGIKTYKYIGQDDAEKLLKGAKVAVKRREDKKGLIYELAIPLNAFKPVVLSSGKIMPFAFIVNDDDGKGRKWIGIDNPAVLGGDRYLGIYPLLLLQP